MGLDTRPKCQGCTHGFRVDPRTHKRHGDTSLDGCSDDGERSNEILNGSVCGMQAFKTDESWIVELGDVFFYNPSCKSTRAIFEQVGLLESKIYRGYACS